ncbi:SipW-dependent-type signal peptide-containing protein [Mycetocola saprophilus]|uniref:SipW-dependent-type signal peptide-containing protein n=1 Tax=Mycetocola saprophilus TaxID=76636 RepID=UPI003BF15308
MTESSSTTPADTAAVPRTSKRKAVRAVLAGGLVLGIGAAVTLAAWNDSEFVQGIFGSGKFDLEGSLTAGGTYASHATAGAAPTLAFTAPLASNLSPGNVTYAPYFVRLAAGTTTDASARIANASATDSVSGAANAANLTYSVYNLAPTATCNAAGVTSQTPIATGTNLTSVSGATDITLTKGADASTAGGSRLLCFVVTAAPGLVQGGTTTATWQITATSL